jgi:hypothetical protein
MKKIKIMSICANIMRNNHTLPIGLIQVPLEASVADPLSRHCNATRIYKMKTNNENKIITANLRNFNSLYCESGLLVQLIPKQISQFKITSCFHFYSELLI